MIYNLFEMFGFLDLLHKNSLKLLWTWKIFLLYSIIDGLCWFNVILLLRTLIVNWSRVSSIINISRWPYLIAVSTVFKDETKDYFVIVTFIYRYEPLDCCSTHFKNWLSGSSMIGRLLKWYSAWIIFLSFESSRERAFKLKLSLT